MLAIMNRSLFVCSLYKCSPLQGSARNTPCRLRKTWDMPLGDWCSTTCPAAEDREANLSLAWPTRNSGGIGSGLRIQPKSNLRM